MACGRCHHFPICWKVRKVREFLRFLSAEGIDDEKLKGIKDKLYKLLSSACCDYLPPEKVKDILPRSSSSILSRPQYKKIS